MTSKYSGRLELLILLACCLGSVLSCRFIPSDPPQAVTAAPQEDQITQPQSTTQAVDSTPAPVTEAENLPNQLKSAGQVGGNTYAVTAAVDHYALAGVGPRMVLLDLEQMVGADGTRSPQTTMMWQSSVLPGVVRSIAVQGNYAYVAAGRGHILIFDISKPLEPKQVSELSDYEYAMSVQVSGGLLFVADNATGLWIASIDDPIHPKLLSTVTLKIPASGLAFEDPYIYLVNMSGGLDVIDVGEPASPAVVGHLDIPEMSTGIALAGKYGYIAAGFKGLWVVDLSDPRNPRKAAERTATMTDGIIIQGNTAYLTDPTRGLLVFNITTPEDPQQQKSVNLTLFNQGVPGQRQMSVLGDWLMVANQNEGVLVMNIQNPKSPRLEQKYAAELSGAAFDVNKQGNLALVTRDYLGLGVLGLDIEQSQDIYIGGQLSYFDGGPIRTAWKQASDGKYVYQADVNRGFVVVDISDPVKPNEIASLSDPQSISYIVLKDHYAIMSSIAHDPKQGDPNSLRSLRTVDISDPANPAPAGVRRMDHDAQAFAIQGDYLYYPDALEIKEQNEGASAALHVLKISNPADIMEISSVDTTATCPVVRAAVINGTILYLGDQSRGICVYDISNPTTPVYLESIKDLPTVFDLALGGSHLYAAGYSEIGAFDVSTPYQPKLVARRTTPGLAYGIDADPEDGFVYVADFDGGVQLYLLQ
jgi:hypothetical protein